MAATISGISYLDETGSAVVLTGQASGFEVTFTAESGGELSLTGISGCFLAVFNFTVTIEVDGATAAEVTQASSASTSSTLP